MQAHVIKIFLFSFVLTASALGQGYSKIIERPDLDDWAWGMELHPDGGTVITSVIQCPDAWGYDRILLSKTDALGDLEYEKLFAFCDSISTEFQLQEALLRIDSFFFMLWFPFDTSNQIFLTKFDLDLNVIFTKSYLTDGVMIPNTLVQISPNRLMLCFGEFRPEETGVERFIKVNLDGDEMDRGTVSFPHDHYRSIGTRFTRSVRFTEQGSLLMSINTAEFWMNPSHYIMEVDTHFNVVRDYHYENLEDFEVRFCYKGGDGAQLAAPLPNGNFVIVNCRDTIELTHPPIMLSKQHPGLTVYTPEGKKVWDTTFISYAGYRVFDMEVDKKGNIYCVGEARASDRTDRTGGAFFLKVTSEGKVVWHRNIYPEFSLHGQGSINDVEVLSDGGVVAAGLIDYRNRNLRSDLDTWLIRLDSNGCITPGCTEEDILLSINDEPGQWRDLEQVPFLVSPNPTSGEIQIQTDFIPKMDDQLVWLDQMGRVILTQELLAQKNQTLSAPSQNGLYMLTLYRNGTVVHTEKIVVEGN